MRASEQVLFEEGKVLVTNRRLVVGSKTYAISSITSVEHQRDARLKRKAIALCVLLLGLTVGVGFLASWHLYTCFAIGAALVLLVTSFVLPVKHSATITTPSGEVQPLSGWGHSKAGLVARVVEGINEAFIVGD